MAVDVVQVNVSITQIVFYMPALKEGSYNGMVGHHTDIIQRLWAGSRLDRAHLKRTWLLLRIRVKCQTTIVEPRFMSAPGALSSPL